MLTYIIKRFLIMVPTLIGISIIAFIVIRLAPGDPSRSFGRQAGEMVDKTEQVAAENIAEFRRLYGLDRPLHIQYAIWIEKLVKFDFGRSIIYKNKKVSELLFRSLIITLQIQFASILLIYLISIPLGIFLSVKENTFTDRTVTVFLFILYSLPSFFVAILLLSFFASSDYFMLFPTRGISSIAVLKSGGFMDIMLDRLWHLILPVFVVSLANYAYLSMQMRANMLEVLRQNYILTAKAKGLKESVVIFKHAARNSMIPVITIFATVLPMMIGGSVILEYVFQIDGMGKLMFESILQRDYNVIMAITFLSAFLTLLGILLSDILYVIVDPRISFD